MSFLWGEEKREGHRRGCKWQQRKETLCSTTWIFPRVSSTPNPEAASTSSASKPCNSSIPIDLSCDFLKSLLPSASTRSPCIKCHSSITPYIIQALLFVLNLAISASPPCCSLCYENGDSSALPCSPAIDDFTEFYLIPSQSSLCKLKSPQWLRPCSCPTCPFFFPSATAALASCALSSHCWVPEAVQGTEGAVPGHSSAPGLLAVPLLSLYLCWEDFSQKTIHTASSISSQVSI